MCRKESEEKLEILYKGEYYDVTHWVHNHPGGDVIKFFTEKGEDATSAILQFHYRSHDEVFNILNSLKKRDATKNDVVLSAETQARHDALTEDYLEIIKEAESERLFEADWGNTWGRMVESGFYLVMFLWGIYPETENLPFHHANFLKTILIIAGIIRSGFFQNYRINRVKEIALYVVLYLWLTYFQNFFLTTFLRIIIITVSLIRSGFLQHEFGHRSMSGNKTFDKFWQTLYMTGILGISTSWWNDRHNCHHAIPQKIHQDRDLDTLPMLACNSKLLENPKSENNFFIQNQDKLFPLNIILVSFYLKFINSPKYIIENGLCMEMIFFSIHHYLVYTLISNDIINIPMYFLIFFLVPIYLYGTLALNHTHLPLSEGSKHWVENCIQNCTNINQSQGINWITGYLSYHIEHHLFPQMAAKNYPKIQNRVKKLAEKYDIPYISHEYSDLVKITLKNLKDVSNEINQMSKSS